MENLNDVKIPLKLPKNRKYQVIGFGENAVDQVCKVPRFPEHDTKVQMDKMLMLGGGTIATACSLCARFSRKALSGKSRTRSGSRVSSRLIRFVR